MAAARHATATRRRPAAASRPRVAAPRRAARAPAPAAFGGNRGTLSRRAAISPCWPRRARSPPPYARLRRQWGRGGGQKPVVGPVEWVWRRAGARAPPRLPRTCSTSRLRPRPILAAHGRARAESLLQAPRVDHRGASTSAEGVLRASRGRGVVLGAHPARGASPFSAAFWKEVWRRPPQASPTL